MLPGEEPSPSKEAKMISEYVKLYCLIFVLLSIGKCFILGPSELLSDLISTAVLFFGCWTFHYLLTASFLMFTLFSVIRYIAWTGRLVQKRVNFNDRGVVIRLVAMSVALCLYFIGWWITFLAYKQFKACSLGYVRPDLWTDPDRERIRTDDEVPEQGQRRQDRQFSAFQGRGVAVG
jgi:hypothetical protein